MPTCVVCGLEINPNDRPGRLVPGFDDVGVCEQCRAFARRGRTQDREGEK